MVYVNVAKGYRPGGLVPIVPAGEPNTATDCVAALKADGPQRHHPETRSYQSDSLWNYELGTKTAWLDHRLTIDAAGFYIHWKNIQQEILLSCGFQYMANSGAAVEQGRRARNARAADGSPRDVARLGLPECHDHRSGRCSPQPVGSPVYQVPDWTGNGAVSYTTQLTTDWKMISGTDYSYIGRSYSGNNQPTDPRLRPSYRLINARMAFDRGASKLRSSARTSATRSPISATAARSRRRRRAGRVCS